MMKQVFKWIKNDPKHAETESSKEKYGDQDTR